MNKGNIGAGRVQFNTVEVTKSTHTKQFVYNTTNYNRTIKIGISGQLHLVPMLVTNEPIHLTFFLFIIWKEEVLPIAAHNQITFAGEIS